MPGLARGGISAFALELVHATLSKTGSDAFRLGAAARSPVPSSFRRFRPRVLQAFRILQRFPTGVGLRIEVPSDARPARGNAGVLPAEVRGPAHQGLGQ